MTEMIDDGIVINIGKRKEAIIEKENITTNNYNFANNNYITVGNNNEDVVCDSLGSIDTYRKNIITRGLSGFCNVGNTCYMNAALQCLFATDLLVAYLRGNETDNCEFKLDLQYATNKKMVDNKDTTTQIDILNVKKKMKMSLAYKLRNLCVIYWGINCKIKPESFKNKLGSLSKVFAGFNQNDSQECLSFILDRLHEDTKTNANVVLKPMSENVVKYNAYLEQYENTLKQLEESKVVHKNNTFKIEQINENIKQLKIHFNGIKNKFLREDTFLRGIKFWKQYLKNNHSSVIDIFSGLYLSEIVCSNCQNHSFTYDPFNLISLSIPKNTNSVTLEACLEQTFNNAEMLNGDNAYNCDNCTFKSDATKTTTLWHSPEKLIIQLKRFNHDNSSRRHSHQKNNIFVKFPLENLNMTPYTSSYTNENQYYDLYGVIYHTGGLQGGHYVAYTKNAVNDKWYLFDDSNVLHIDDNEIENKINTGGAYVLFYRKKKVRVSTE